ncbi:MAG: FAD-dependent oxidoreductase [bacterium]|nr:FAD-dependent oxidoreductase [bacterium]
MTNADVTPWIEPWWTVMVSLNVLGFVLCLLLFRHSASAPPDRYNGYRKTMRTLGLIFVCVALYRTVFVSSYLEQLAWFDTVANSALIIRFLAFFAELSFAGLFALSMRKLDSDLPPADRANNVTGFLLRRGPHVLFACIFIAQFFATTATVTKLELLFAIEETLWGIAFLSIIPLAIDQLNRVSSARSQLPVEQLKMYRIQTVMIAAWCLFYCSYSLFYHLPIESWPHVIQDLRAGEAVFNTGMAALRDAAWVVNRTRDYESWGGDGLLHLAFGVFQRVRVDGVVSDEWAASPARRAESMTEFPTVAVVGAGIAGSSAAWYLRQGLGEGAAITVYERDPLVGGRLATVDVGGTPVEAGGTIIHETNRNMAGFVDRLGLQRVEPHQRDGGGAESVGVWDGRRLVFRTHASTLRTRLSAAARYGVRAPLRMQRAVARGVEQWNTVYAHVEEGRGFRTPHALCSELGLARMLEIDGRQWLSESGVRGRFVDEYASPVGRVMYGQDVSMHALATSIALAGAGLAGSLFSVGGGNRLVCEGLLREADAQLHTGSEVVGVSRAEPGFALKLSEGAAPRHDVVVLATPAGAATLELGGLELSASALRPRPFQTTWPRSSWASPVRTTSGSPIRRSCPIRCSPWRMTRSRSRPSASWVLRPTAAPSTSSSAGKSRGRRCWIRSSPGATRSSRCAGGPIPCWGRATTCLPSA